MYHECNQLREQAATPNEHIEHRFLAMRAGEAAEKLFDLFEQYRELHGTEEQLLAYKEGRALHPRKDTRDRFERLYEADRPHTEHTNIYSRTALRRSTAQLSAAQATAPSGACRCCMNGDTHRQRQRPHADPLCHRRRSLRGDEVAARAAPPLDA